MDTKAFFKLSYGVYVVTSKNNEKEGGCVINTMTQITAVPPQVSITIQKEHFTTKLIQESKIFNVSVLLADDSMDIIQNFGYQSGKDVDKFQNGEYDIDKNGVKYLKHAAACFQCRVKESIDVGTHIMFIADVEDAKVLKEQEVLTYEAYHQKKNAAVSKGWICDVCGFIYEGEVLPDDFICPICEMDATHFTKL